MDSQASSNLCRILVVDDNRVELKALLQLLEGPEFAVTLCQSGEEAIEHVKEETPSLVLCDVIMHGISGFDVCRWIRNNELTRDIAFFLMSTTDTREARIQAFESGADGFITKPFSSVEVRAIIKNMVRMNRMQRMAEQREQVERALKQLQETYDETIQGWVRALDLRDNETENHSQRVATMTAELAQAMGFKGNELVQIWRGALLHDVGKIGVPDAILHKEGALTAEERAQMQKHPEFAYDLLSPIEYLRAAIDIPYSHHERWDGNGYPLGLKGEEIPIAARIFAVVDVYDALRSNRPYKRGWDEESTLAEIKKMAGSHFDPRIVEHFIRMRQQSSLRAA